MDRQKLTVTIAGDLFAQIDAVIDGETIRNRSHAAEYLIRRGLGEHGLREAVILAGGRGAKLGPLTLELPKALIPVHGRPLLAHTLSLLARHDIRSIIICLGYKSQLIKDHFGNGRSFGVSIRYIEEDQPLGTAGPLQLARPFLPSPFLLVNGDVLSDIDLTDLVRSHRSSGKLATLALVNVTDPEPFGAAKMQGNSVIEFIEKPVRGQQPTNFINAGFTVCEPGFLDYIPTGTSMLEADVYPRLALDGQLAAYPFAGQWFHVGTPAQYELALREWRSLNGS